MITMDLIEQAFRNMPRKSFVPDVIRDNADIDAPLPIGFGQTNSQPTTVQLMLSWLDAQPGDKILDVGSGSGWTTALLSQIVGSNGKVYAVEIIPELVELGKENCNRAGIQNAQFIQAGNECGLLRFAPYDRILVSASAQKLPNELLNQLKIGGKLVIPVQNDILEIVKSSKDKHDIKIHSGFVFVPLV